MGNDVTALQSTESIASDNTIARSNTAIVFIFEERVIEERAQRRQSFSPHDQIAAGTCAHDLR